MIVFAQSTAIPLEQQYTNKYAKCSSRYCAFHWNIVVSLSFFDLKSYLTDLDGKVYDWHFKISKLIQRRKKCKTLWTFCRGRAIWIFISLLYFKTVEVNFCWKTCYTHYNLKSERLETKIAKQKNLWNFQFSHLFTMRQYFWKWLRVTKIEFTVAGVHKASKICVRKSYFHCHRFKWKSYDQFKQLIFSY